MSEPAVKLTAYFGERKRVGDRFLADALLELLERHAVRAGVLLRGAEGFGQQHRFHTDRLLTLSESLPAVAVAVDAPDRIDRLAEDAAELAGHGLTTTERARLLTPGESLPRSASELVKLTLYGGRSVRADGQAGYVAAIERLRRAGAEGVSVLLAVDGMLHGQRRRARFFSRNAGVPLMLLAIGARHALDSALPELAGLLDDPVVTEERIEVCKSAGRLLAEPALAAPQRDASGASFSQKLTVYVEEQARLGGHPLYVELVRRLREAGAAGATALRGVRGFYGHHEPFADRLLSLRRNVPVHVIVIDTPEHMQRWWPIIDEVTRDHGLVTAELATPLSA